MGRADRERLEAHARGVGEASAAPTADELLEQLTAAYEPLWAARKEVQRIAVEALQQIARECAPEATVVVLDDSDQPHATYVFSHFEDKDGNEIDVDDSELPDDIWRAASDLDLDSIPDYRIEVNP